MAFKNVKLRLSKNKFIDSQIPDDEEIAVAANRLHSKRAPALEIIQNFKVFYRPSGIIRYGIQAMNPFTAEKIGCQQNRETVVPAELHFGYGSMWRVVLMWKNGDDQPPEWFRYGCESIVEEPERTESLFG